MNLLITDSGVGSILENSDKLLPIIDDLDEDAVGAYFLGLPAVIGLFCFLPGLLLGLLLPPTISWALIVIIIVVSIIFLIMVGLSDGAYQKKYIKRASEEGISSDEADEFYAFWKGLNSKARKRLTKEMKRKQDAKNK